MLTNANITSLQFSDQLHSPCLPLDDLHIDQNSHHLTKQHRTHPNMLSFPLIPPRDQSIWPTPTHLSSPPSPPSTHQPGHHSHHPNSHHPHHPHHPSSRRNPTAADGAYPHHSHHLLHAQHARPSPLALLRADERALAHRKQNIRRFGAGWIRPPGVQKTYQAAMEEAAEKEEQEVLARREREMLDLAAATEAGDGAGDGWAGGYWVGGEGFGC
ncbi:hypothetical protein EV356DRAFT_366309 [Viridothelium virens]|uniref:Uncharacterized protein n=1 Tax=Viridothelium virens TaxID=1048519 RepID=A0A6A6GWF1_VIRVR|nr:hypothetical protein EV356DRAFT_366309 [Viridothelium virens]